MRKFITKLVLFTLFIVSLDRLFILVKYNEKNLFTDISKNKLTRLADYLHRKHITSTDIAIYGSSHPQFAISPEILSQATHETCINFAYGGGSNIGAQYEFIKKLDVPCKTLVYAIDVFSLNDEAAKSDDFQPLFFNGSRAFNLNEDYLRYSNMYLYSHFVPKYLADLRHGNYRLPYLRKSDSTDLSMFSRFIGYDITPAGWVRGNGFLNKSYLRYANLLFEPKRTSKEALEHIVAYCRDKGIGLLIIQTPESAAALNYSQKYIEFNKWMIEFAAANRITYLNFDNPGAFPVNNDSLFFDSDHLNTRGAELFSQQLAKALLSARI